MKQRHTFTLSPDVAARARHYARGKGISMSALVEELLKEKTRPRACRRTVAEASFSRRWMGKGTLANDEEPRARKLRRKYDL